MSWGALLAHLVSCIQNKLDVYGWASGAQTRPHRHRNFSYTLPQGAEVLVLDCPQTVANRIAFW
jgi:hypothetical protein